MLARVVLVALGILLGIGGTLVVSSWVDVRAAHLESDGNSIGVPVSPEASPGSHSLQIAGLCLSGAEEARVTSVHPVDPIGPFEVTGFTLTGMQDLGRQEPGPLKTYVQNVESFTTGPRTTRVSTRCSKDHDYRGLAVQIADPPSTELPAVTGAFVVEYEIGGRSKTLTAQTSVILCAGDDRDRELAQTVDADGDTIALGDCSAV